MDFATIHWWTYRSNLFGVSFPEVHAAWVVVPQVHADVEASLPRAAGGRDPPSGFPRCPFKGNRWASLVDD